MKRLLPPLVLLNWSLFFGYGAICVLSGNVWGQGWFGHLAEAIRAAMPGIDSGRAGVATAAAGATLAATFLWLTLIAIDADERSAASFRDSLRSVTGGLLIVFSAAAVFGVWAEVPGLVTTSAANGIAVLASWGAIVLSAIERDIGPAEDDGSDAVAGQMAMAAAHDAALANLSGRG